MGHLAYFFQRKNTILFIQIASVLILISTVLTWVTATGLPSTATTNEVSLSGGEMASTIRSMGIVGVAGGVAATIAKGKLRGVIGSVVLGAAVIAFIGALLAAVNPAAAAAPALSEYTGTTELADSYSVGFAVTLALIGSVMLIITSLALLIFSPGWEDSTASKKYSRGTSGTDNPDEIDMWDDLSDGQDPTK